MDTGNDYIGALKGNQSGLLEEVEAHFIPEQTYTQVDKGHGRLEKRTVSICQSLEGIRRWPGERNFDSCGLDAAIEQRGAD